MLLRVKQLGLGAWHLRAGRVRVCRVAWAVCRLVALVVVCRLPEVCRVWALGCPGQGSLALACRVPVVLLLVLACLVLPAWAVARSTRLRSVVV